MIFYAFDILQKMSGSIEMCGIYDRYEGVNEGVLIDVHSGQFVQIFVIIDLGGYLG